MARGLQLSSLGPRQGRAPIFAEGLTVHVGSTIGIALSPQDGMTASALLHEADLAMYEGKRGGRGAYRFFDQEMEGRLRGVLHWMGTCAWP